MIRLIGLNKYYKNSLHVINNTTLELPNTGLITFLGKSGSGKTTLLNVIGGLDKASSGTIAYEEFVLKKYNMHKIDVYRRKNVGYIFQNYLLLEELSVYDNLKEALELIGITDKTEQKERIEYALKAVGLYKFRKKKANRLSGGQMQRVSIARALIKKCRLIIADEPTGNLDSENTIEVMNILKKISESTLVLLVTHNAELATFYSDRIITIKDGKVIADDVNTSSGTLNTKNDRKIYLKDLELQNITYENINLNVYSEVENPHIDLKIIIKNDTIYIDTLQKIVRTSDVGVELIDDHYHHLELEKVKDFNFDISWYKDKKDKNPFVKFFKLWKKAFLAFINTTRKTKIFRIIFIIIGMIMGLCSVSLFKYISVDDTAFCFDEVDTLVSKDMGFYYESYDEAMIKDAISKGFIEKVYPTRQVYSGFKYKLNSVRFKNVQITTYPFSASNIEEPLKIGKMPKEGEIVIGRKLADIICNSIEELDYESLLGKKMWEEGTDNYIYAFHNELNKYTISGVSNEPTTSVYFNEEEYSKVIPLFFQVYYATKNIESVIDDVDSFSIPNIYNKKDVNYQIKDGIDITNTNEILIRMSDALKERYGTFLINTIVELEGTYYKIVGEYTSEDNDNDLEILTIDNRLMGKCVQFNGNELATISFNTVMYHQDYETVGISEADLVVGRLPLRDDEVIINEYLPYAIGDSITYSDRILRIVGKTSNKNYGKIYTTYKEAQYLNYIITESNFFEIAGTKEAKDYFSSKGYQIKTPYNKFYEMALRDQSTSKVVPLVFAILMLIATVIYVYFSTRSRIIADVKTIGIYRSMGATRLDIIKNYFLDIILETTFTTLLGYILTITIYSSLMKKIYEILGVSKNIGNPLLFIFGGLLIYIIDVVFGLIPVMNLLRKTPSEINSKYDI